MGGLLGLVLGWGWAVVPLADAADLATIQRRKLLIVGVKESLRPLAYRNAQGELQGLEIDLAKRLAADLLGSETALKLVPLANRDRLPALLSDRVDVVIAQVTANRDRERLVAFSPPYYFDGTALLGLDRETAVGPAAPSRRRIAVLAGSSSFSVIKVRFPQSQLLPVGSYAEAKRALDNGPVDAFAGDRTVLTGWLQAHPGYQWLGPRPGERLSTEPLAIALPKGLAHEPLRQQVNASVNRWLQSGWLQERWQHWGLPR